jgi:DNA adenine methylase
MSQLLLYSDFIQVPREGRRPAPVLKKRLAFRWYGGKFSHLDWLLPLLPVKGVRHFCEPFGGSGAVILNRSPAEIETYNDLDGEVVNFFKVLRDQPQEIIHALSFSPFSREEFELACTVTPNLSDIERARRFFIRAGQVRTGLAQTASLGRWANCVDTSRSGMSGAVSRWLNKIKGLEAIVQRLCRVQIENRPAANIIKLYDSPGTLFYLDPPYPHDSRKDSKAYSYEMTNLDHEYLSEILHNITGRAAISGYRGTLMDRLYKDWERIDAAEKQAHSCKDLRQESLWINYAT